MVDNVPVKAALIELMPLWLQLIILQADSVVVKPKLLKSKMRNEYKIIKAKVINQSSNPYSCS